MLMQQVTWRWRLPARSAVGASGLRRRLAPGCRTGGRPWPYAAPSFARSRRWGRRTSPGNSRLTVEGLGQVRMLSVMPLKDGWILRLPDDRSRPIAPVGGTLVLAGAKAGSAPPATFYFYSPILVSISSSCEIVARRFFCISDRPSSICPTVRAERPWTAVATTSFASGIRSSSIRRPLAVR